MYSGEQRYIAALDCARHAGVGHGSQGQRGCGAHGLDGCQYRRGAGGAVHADGACAPLGEQGGGVRGRCAVKAVALVVDGDHNQHWQVRSDIVRSLERLLCLVQGGHGFDNQQVNTVSRTVSSEHGDLLGEGGAGFVEAGFAERFKAYTERSDGAGNPGLAGLLFYKVIDGFARQPHASFIDFTHLAAEAVPGEAEAVGAKGVGLNDFGAGLKVLFVHGEDKARVGEIQFVVAAVDEHAARIEHRSHGAVGKHGAAQQGLGELRHSVDNAIASGEGDRPGSLRSRAVSCYPLLPQKLYFAGRLPGG